MTPPQPPELRGDGPADSAEREDLDGQGSADGADVVIVGAGVAGLSAGLVLARARRRVVCVDAGSPRNAPAEHVHGFLSRDQTPPAELLALGVEDIARYGATLLDGEAVGLETTNRGFDVALSDGRRVTGRAVVVATGLVDELPAVAGLAERWGNTVLHCPYCHGWEVRDAPLAVVGGANRAFTMHQVQLVRQWSPDVVFVTNGLVLDGEERERLTARGIEIVDDPVRGVVDHHPGPVALEFTDGRLLPRAAVFVGPRFVPRDQLLVALGCERDDTGAIRVDPTGHTSVPGVWAVGNVARDTQAIVSAASGVSAGIAVNHHLLAQDVEHAVGAARRADPAATRAPTWAPTWATP